jgi:endonuclease/exonuclease/phosphatase family metal-dependent hydrolase
MTGAEASVVLNAVHWNVHSWVDPGTGRSNVGQVEALLDEASPDLVSLVEVNETWGEPSRLVRVASRCGYVAVFPPVFEYGEQGGPSGGFGNAVLSRLPVEVVLHRQLTWPDGVYQGSEATERRGVVLVRVTTERGTAWFGSTHLPAGDADARSAAGHRLSDALAGLAEPWVVAGDFNAEPATWPELEAMTRVGPLPATRPSEDPKVAIDYAIASPDLRIVVRALDRGGSDHLPVSLTARLRRDDGQGLRDVAVAG